MFYQIYLRPFLMVQENSVESDGRISFWSLLTTLICYMAT